MARGTTKQAEGKPTEPQADGTTEATEDTNVLESFEAAVKESLENRDVTTGTLAGVDVERVAKVYRELPDIKAKNKAKAFLSDNMASTLKEGTDFPRARSYQQLLADATQPAKSAPAAKKPADPTQAFVEQKVGLQLALGTLVVPTGVAEDHEERSTKLYQELAPQVQAYRAWEASEAEDKGDAPEVSPVVRHALKLQTGKAGRKSGSSTPRVSGGPRRSVEKHISEVFAELDSGTFLTVSEIHARKSSEYGDDAPSQGAISARLFPGEGKQSTVEGVTPDRNAKGTKGATKN